MASLSHVVKYVIVLLLLTSKRTFSSRLARSITKVAQIGVDDYPSSGRNSPVRDLGFPSFQEAMAAPPPPLPDLPILPPPSFSNLETPTVTVPALPSLPDFPPFPFVDQTPPSETFTPPSETFAPPSETFAPRLEESGNWMPSTPSNPEGFP